MQDGVRITDDEVVIALPTEDLLEIADGVGADLIAAGFALLDAGGLVGLAGDGLYAEFEAPLERLLLPAGGALPGLVAGGCNRTRLQVDTIGLLARSRHT